MPSNQGSSTAHEIETPGFFVIKPGTSFTAQDVRGEGVCQRAFCAVSHYLVVINQLKKVSSIYLCVRSSNGNGPSTFISEG